MSKRTQILLTFALLLVSVALGAGAVLWMRAAGFGPFGDPVFTDTIPEKRPRRPDRRLLEEFSNMTIPEIVAVLRTREDEDEDEDEAPPAEPEPVDPPLLAMLPDAPLPFPADAPPRDTEGLKAFVTGIQKEPDKQPTESERWQFNLALAALGVKPEEVPEAIRMETRPASEIDTFPVRLLSRPSEGEGPFAVGDFDGDDGVEIVAGGGSRFFRVGEGRLIEALEVLDGVEPGKAVFPADFDRDGGLDFFLARGGGLPDSLIRNEGGGKFTDVTVALGLLAFGDTTSAAWLDYDQDGRPDLLVGSRDRPLELYRQTETGLFEAVAWDLKLWIPGDVRRIVVGDFTGDGYPDFFVDLEGRSGRLYANRPAASWSEWRFEELPVATDSSVGGEVTGAAFFDFDNDGRLDLILAYGEPKAEPAPDQPLAAAGRFVRLLRNEGEGRFSDVTETSGLDPGGPVTALGIADLDLDGFEDVLLGRPALVPNEAFLNLGGSGFSAISVASGSARLDAPLVYVSADLGGNGSTDLLVLDRSGRLQWLEAAGAPNRWLRLCLPGQPVGTRISLAVRDADWVVQNLERRLGADATLTVGLGSADGVEQIEIRDGIGGEALKVLETVPANDTITVELPKKPLKRAVVPLDTPVSDPLSPP